MLVLSESEISSLLLSLTPPQLSHLQDALDTALVQLTTERTTPDHASPQLHQPSRTHFTTTTGTTTLVMPSSTTALTAVKTVSVAPSSPPLGAITLFSPLGSLTAVLSAAELTGFRTALLTSCALRHALRTGLFRPAAPQRLKAVVFGAGTQARWHAWLLARTAGVAEVTLVNRSAGRRGEELAARLRGEGLEVATLVREGNGAYAEALEEELKGADVVLGTTPATEPYFAHEVLERWPRGRFVGLVGSYKKEMREVDSRTLGSGGKVLVDSKRDVLVEAGEVIEAGLGEEELVELGAALRAGEELGVGRDGTVVFKCVGFALLDLTVAREVVEIAERSGKGTKVEGF